MYTVHSHCQLPPIRLRKSWKHFRFYPRGQPPQSTARRLNITLPNLQQPSHTVH
jgi:hypothetical protein